ncbi:MAG: hypothetical protein K2X38_01120 [Gemmataceae bacterium]|nr:hypothetical protein [Gemmataceae bacterium]
MAEASDHCIGALVGDVHGSRVAHQAKQTANQVLENRATHKGMDLSEGLRFIDILPLRFYFHVDVELAVAEVESVARFRDQNL